MTKEEQERYERAATEHLVQQNRLQHRLLEATSHLTLRSLKALVEFAECTLQDERDSRQLKKELNND